MMSKNNVSQLRLHSVSVALGALLVGCFDTTMGAVGDAAAVGGTGGSRAIVPALLIDNFEDGNRVPSDLQFGPWRCFAYTNPDGSDPTCKASSPGNNNSEYGFHVDFELVDTKNGKLDYPGVVLHTQTTAPFDVSPYENIVFSAKLEPRDTPLPDPVYLTVRWGCSTIASVDPNSGVLSINAAVQPTRDWQTFSMPLASFVQPPWASDQLSIDERGCAKVVDELWFGYVLEYAAPGAAVDGESVAATLTIDDVYLQ